MAGIRKIICFDIDGTLVKSDPSSNMVHKDAFSHAMKHVFSVDARIEEIAHQGMTDMWILEEVLERHGIPLEVSRARMTDLKDEMVKYCR